MKLKIEITDVQATLLGEFLDRTIFQLKELDIAKGLNVEQKALLPILELLEYEMWEQIKNIPNSDLNKKIQKLEDEIRQAKLN